MVKISVMLRWKPKWYKKAKNSTIKEQDSSKEVRDSSSEQTIRIKA